MPGAGAHMHGLPTAPRQAQALPCGAVCRDVSRNQCAVGFSAVLFGLKYVLTHGQPGMSYAYGLPFQLPTKFIAWAGAWCSC